MSQSCKFYLDIFRSGESDHPFCQIQYFDRFTHIKNIDLTAFAHSAGFKHQLTSLGNSHKIADNLRMGYRNRTSILYLFPEQWYY
ncbi:hypothetical protein SDC9_180147 [bioreactor metagenome]|uniref:Uncharacterized protein n=1 Tax=bioreactor metagenome TaxID=1076179 RepID=A0A645H0W2_9ZZZZ